MKAWQKVGNLKAKKNCPSSKGEEINEEKNDGEERDEENSHKMMELDAGKS